MTKDRAITLFHEHGGMLRTSDALRLGIHPRTLYALRDDGTIQPIQRGLYQLVGFEPQDHGDLVTVTTAAPRGIICMVSALAFHNLTTQIPHRVDVACMRGTRPPRLIHPPVRVFWMATGQFDLGIEEHVFENVRVRIYNAERTIVDCFKFRNRIGLDIALESLKTYWREKRGSVDNILNYATPLRMDKVIKPYLQGIIEE